MADIQSGKEILEYVQQIKIIIAKLEQAETKLKRIDDTINSTTEHYEGNAKEEIHMFCFSQMTHLQKVKSFYNKAAQYATLYFSEMQFTDEELSKIILSFFEDKKVG